MADLHWRPTRLEADDRTTLSRAVVETCSKNEKRAPRKIVVTRSGA